MYVVKHWIIIDMSIQCLYIIFMCSVFVLEEKNVQLCLKYEYFNQILLTFEIHFEFFPLDFRQQHSFWFELILTIEFKNVH